MKSKNSLPLILSGALGHPVAEVTVILHWENSQIWTVCSQPWLLTQKEQLVNNAERWLSLVQTFKFIMSIQTVEDICPSVFYLWPALCVVLVTFSFCDFVCGAAILLPPCLEGSPENSVDEEHICFDWLAGNSHVKNKHLFFTWKLKQPHNTNTSKCNGLDCFPTCHVSVGGGCRCHLGISQPRPPCQGSPELGPREMPAWREATASSPPGPKPSLSTVGIQGSSSIITRC